MWRIEGGSRCSCLKITNLSIATFLVDTRISTSFSPILEGWSICNPRHLVLCSMMQRVLVVFLLAAVSTKANSNVDTHGSQNSNLDSHGSQNSNMDTHGSQNSSRNVQSQGTRSENGCWQIKYYYRLDSFYLEYFSFSNHKFQKKCPIAIPSLNLF